MAHQRVCYALRCAYTSDEPIDVCPKCGRKMRSANSVRVYGGLQLLLGIFLVVFMGVITLSVLPMMMHAVEPQGGSRFTGTSSEALVILSLFGLVIAFGFGSSLAGLYQVIMARRNKWLFIAVLGLSVLIWIAANAVYTALG